MMNRIQIRQGANVHQIIEACQLPDHLKPHARVYLDGLDVTDLDGFTCLANDNLRVHVSPLGGGGGSGGGQKKSIMAIVLTIVVAVVAWYVGAVLVGGGIAGTLTSAAITMVGNMAINALVKPSSLSTKDRENQGTPMITGQSNQAKPYQVVPRIFGRVLFYPNLAVQPNVTNRTFYSGYEAVYDFGYGDIQVEMASVKIGNSGASAYSPNLQLSRNSFMRKDDMKLYSTISSNEQLSILFTNKTNGGIYTVITADDCISAEVNFFLPSGLWAVQGNGEPGNLFIIFNAKYRKVGTTTWTRITKSMIKGALIGDDLVGGANYYSIGSADQRPYTWFIRIPFAAKGKYEIQLERWSNDFNGPVYYSQCYINLLESKLAGAPFKLRHRHTMLEMSIEASGKLQGVVQNLSAMCTSVLRTTTNGTSFVTVPTRNPAWIAIEIMTGEATPNAIPDTQIDWPSWITFAEYCDESVTRTVNGITITRARHTADFVVDYETTVNELLQSLLGSARAALTMTHDGKYSVLIDRDRGLVPDRQLITPANSWNFQGSRQFLPRPNALRVSYVDGSRVNNTGRGDWQETEVIVYDDGFDETNAVTFEEIGTFGITDYMSAWSYGRYMLAQGIWRSEQFSVDMDVENLAASRGDLVAVSHYTPMVGGQSTRIKTVVDNIIIVVDEASGATHYTVRNIAGTVRTGVIVSQIGFYEYELDTAVDLHPDDLIVFGNATTTTSRYIVQAINPSKDLTASLTLVRYVPEIYLVDTMPIPDWVPDFGMGDGVFDLSIDNLTGVQRIYFENRSPVYEVSLTWTFSPTKPSYYEVVAQYANNDFVQSFPVYEHQFIDIIKSNLRLGNVTYTVTPYSPSGKAGIGASVIVNAGADVTPPPPVLGFALDVDYSNWTINAHWPLSRDVNIDYYLLRYTPLQTQTDVNISSVYVKINNQSNTKTLPFRNGIYFMQAVDTSGNVSEAVRYKINSAILGGPHLQYIDEKATGYIGSKDNVIAYGDHIRLAGDFGSISPVGYYYFSGSVDLGSVITVRISNLIEFYAYDNNIYSINHNLWRASVEYRQSNDHTVWSEWTSVQVSDVICRYLEFRVKMESFDQNIAVIMDNGGILVNG